MGHRNTTSASIQFFWIITSVTCWFSPHLALATDRYFPDREVRSPDGHWRVTAKSPDNQKKLPNGGAVPFAKDFTYTLYDDQRGTAVWSRRQPESEYSPMGVFLDDQGWVIVRTGWEQLVVLDRTDGKAALTVKLLDQFPEEERKNYVHDTTAGPMWDKRSLSHFVVDEGRTLFVIRAWWDRRIVVDLAAGKLLPDEGTVRAALDVADREWALRTLEASQKAGPPASFKSRDLPDTLRDNLTAAHIAGRMKIRDAVPALRELEKWDWFGACVFGHRFRHLNKGEINPASYCFNELRQVVQLALRRIGEKPAGLAAIGFHYVEKDELFENGKDVEVKNPIPDRVEGAVRIQKGMTPAEVLAVLGAPDFVARRNSTEPGGTDVWEYDLDADPTYTFRITWDHQEVRVASVERLTPALWQTNTRDEDID